MKDSIFRKKSLDKISSPEQLNDYIKVANPSIIISLVAIIILLIGICVWGIFGTIDTTASFVAVVEDGTMTIYAEEDIINVLDVLTVEDTEVTINTVYNIPTSAENLNPYAIYLLGVNSNTFLYYSTANTVLGDGIYSGEIITETLHPIYFITN